MSRYVIGVAGPSCGGKTTVCNKICEKVEELSTLQMPKHESIIGVISQDNYYKGGNSETNYDVPNALDFDLMVMHLEVLLKGGIIDMPLYDFSTHNRKHETQKVGPVKIIIIEGILIFTQDTIRNFCNLKVFVEAEDAVCCIRRLTRDREERGRTFEEIQTRYIEHVVPCFNNYIKPSKYHADISLLNNTHGQFIGLQILLDHIEKKINIFLQ